MAKIEILSGPEAGKKFQLDRGRWVAGRGEDCDLRIPESSISRHHAAFTNADDGTWSVEDLGSHNGVFIEGRRITAREPLAGVTKLRLGTVETIFTPDRAGGEISPTTEDAVDEGSAVVIRPPAQGNLSTEARRSPEENIKAVEAMAKIYPAIEQQFGRVIVGQKLVLEQLMVAVAAGGHCLMVGLPGLAKTLMVSTLSRLLKLSFKRIQFTPDLMPSDIIGTEVLEVNEATGQKSFRFVKGPIFTNMLLADEINRTPPKTQAALLEAMQERQVTVANHVFPLPQPFFVLATQNPLEQEGTYPLPEAQLDRFMFNIIVDYPAEEEEETIVLATTARQEVDLQPVLDAPELLSLQAAVRDLPVSKHVVKYATRLVRSTRPKNEGVPQFIKDYVFCGAGPRAAQNLILGAKAKAVIHGRLNVSCEDIRDLAPPVLRHRLFTNFTADSEGVTPDELVRRLVLSVPEPGPDDYKE